MENRNAKSLLAKLMASEDINVEYSEKASTASFDTENRTLRMPVFKDISNEATDLFLGHEVGHALYTPEGEIINVLKKGNMYKGFVNVVEDARIEKMIQNKFPGLRRCFYDGYSELMDRDFFGTNGKDPNDYNFIDRLNLHFKAGIRAGLEFSNEEMIYVDRMSNLRTWEETINLSDDLYEYSKDKGEDAEPENFDDGSDSSDSGESGPDDSEMNWDGDTDSDDNNEETGDDAEAEDGSGESDEEGKSTSDDDSETDTPETVEESKTGSDAPAETSTSEESTNSKEGSDENNSELSTKTQDNFDSKLESLVDTESEYCYFRIPNVYLKELIVPMNEIHAEIDKEIERESTDRDIFAEVTKDFKKFSSEQKSLISYLIKEFEMRKSADEHKRTKEGKTGILNPNKLHAYKFSEDIFLRNSVVSDGKNHGFVMFVDWSGSMSNCMGDTIDQLMMLALFCKKAQIPFDVFAFSNSFHRYDDDCNGYHKNNDTVENDIGIMKSFNLLHLISSTLKTASFNKSMIYMQYLRNMFKRDGMYSYPARLSLGGTPLNEAIIAAMEVVPMFKKKNNVQVVNTIFLTDGQGHNSNRTWQTDDFKSSRGNYNHSYVVDPITKKHYKGVPGDKILLEILKDRTGTTLAGFFITDAAKRGFTIDMNYAGVRWDKIDDLWDSMKKEGYGVVESLGYDEYYILSSKTLKIETEGLEIDSDMSKGKMKNAFIKAQKGKIANKKMLSRFAELVS